MLIIIILCILIVLGYLFLKYGWLYHLFICVPKIIHFKYKHKRKGLHLYGVYGFCAGVDYGEVGSGKTLSMVNYANKMRQKYGKNLFICSNFGYRYQDASFNSFKDLKVIRFHIQDTPILALYDEIQNDAFCRDFKSLPQEAIWLLNQNRKGKGMQLCYTCPEFNKIDPVIRNLTNQVIICKTFFNCFTVNGFFTRGMLANVRKKEQEPRKVRSFVHSDRLYKSYDTYRMVFPNSKTNSDKSS